MKVKSDFITNSSSTNFIISVPNRSVDLNTTISSPVNLSNYITKTFTTEEEVIDYYGDEYSEEVEKIINEIKNGKMIHILECSDQGDFEEGILCEYGLGNVKIPKGVKIIRGDGGY